MADTILTHGYPATTTLIATTLDNRRKDMQDQIFDDMPALRFLKSKAQVIVKGGATIVGSLMFGKNDTIGWYHGRDPIETRGQEGFSTYQYEWKECAGSINVSNREETIQNTGPSAVFDIVEQKMQQLKMSFDDELSTMMFRSGPSAKQPESLVSLINATSTVGAINSTTYSWWQANVDTSGSWAAQGPSDLLTLYNAQLVEGAKPDFHLVTPAVSGIYENSLIPSKRYSGTGTGDMSFSDLSYKGAPVIFDTKCTSGVWYMLDSRHLQFYVNANNNMKLTNWKEPHNQTAKVAQVILGAAMGTNNRRRLGLLNTISA